MGDAKVQFPTAAWSRLYLTPPRLAARKRYISEQHVATSTFLSEEAKCTMDGGRDEIFLVGPNLEEDFSMLHARTLYCRCLRKVDLNVEVDCYGN